VVYIVIYTDCFDFYCCFTVIFTMGSSSSDRISIQKLKGASNYEVWALRTEAFLIKEGLKEAISSDLFDLEEDINDKALANIKLLVEDGPLLQIQHISTALEAWESFKNLYSPKGFTSEFLICREFFNTTLDNLSSMEEYLNKVKQLSDQLKAKQLELPKQVIIAWVLNSLTDEYEGFVSNITQSLRNDSEIFTLETLFSNLLDESKRQDNKDSHNQALFTYNKDNCKYKGKKPYKITRPVKSNSHLYAVLATNLESCYSRANGRPAHSMELIVVVL
jgi:gag-polypeptide of LTR copia-type